MVEAGLFPSDEILSETLARLSGSHVDPARLKAQWREWRWVARVPPYVVFIADSADAWSRLEQEADLLDAARKTLGSLVPEVLARDTARRIQVRDHKDGITGWEIEERIFGVKTEQPPLRLPRYARDCPLTPWGETFAADLGAVLARFHRGTTTEALASRVKPYSIDWVAIDSVVREHTDDFILHRACRELTAWDSSRPQGEVVLHGDPHLHNVFASESGHVAALIDLDEACLGDRHEDLKYLHSQGPRFTEIAMAAYETEAGVILDRQLAGRMHVRSAFEHFAWVQADAPRFPRIVDWALESLRALTPQWAT